MKTETANANINSLVLLLGQDQQRAMKICSIITQRRRTQRGGITAEERKGGVDNIK